MAQYNGLLDKRELSEYLGVGLTTVQAYCRRPKNPLKHDIKVGVTFFYDKDKAVAWQAENIKANHKKLEFDNPSDLEDYELARSRKMAADANRAELKLEIERQSVISISKAIKMVSDEYSAARTKLLSIPKLQAAYLAGEDNVQKCEELIDKAIRSALDELTFDRKPERELGRSLSVKDELGDYEDE